MMHRIFIVLLLALHASLLSQDIYFEHFDMKDGLSDNSVRDIIQDRKGYLWFATLDGLNRYDGKFFRKYLSVPGDTNSLSNSRIVKILEDRQGYIWCWSDDHNIQRVDPLTNRVLNLHTQILKKEVPIRDFIITSSGDIWLWGSQGCIRISYRDNKGSFSIEEFNKENDFPDNRINFVVEDKQGGIWIGTEQGLITLAFPSSGNKSINTVFYDRSFISNYQAEDDIWFGCRSGGVVRYSLTTREFSAFDNLSRSLAKKQVFCISGSGENTILLGSARSLYIFDAGGDRLDSVTHPQMHNAFRIYTDSFGETWIASQGKGVFRYISGQKDLKYYPLKAGERLFLGEPDKQLLFEDSKGQLWIGIHGGGLFRYNREEDQFHNYRYDAERSATLSSDVVISVFEDNSKNLWVGTMYGGVNKIKLPEKKFIWQHPLDHPENIFENEIRSIAEDRIGRLWAGSKGGKIYCYHKDDLQYIFPDDLHSVKKQKLANINVYSLHIDTDDNLWIGTKGKGVFVIKGISSSDPGDSEIIHFETQLSDALKQVYSIAQDKYGRIWIGSHGSGIAMLSDPFSNPEFISFSARGTPGALVSDLIRCLFFDMEDNLWIGSSGGISLLPANQLLAADKTFLGIGNIKDDLSSLSYNNVDHIIQAEDGTIYVATMGGGLNILSYHSIEDEFFEWQYFNTSDGLSSNTLYALQEGSEGIIWISTSLGVNKYYPERRKFENFFVEKQPGLNYFSEGCGIRNSKGDILFGHNSGFLRFSPTDIIKDSTQFPVVLSNLYINGVKVMPGDDGIIDKSIEAVDRLRLTHFQNSIRFDFSVLDFGDPDKIQFTFMLENYDEDWSTPLTENSAVYQNLSHGKYKFLLRATNSDGVEIRDTREIIIHITPPFFQSALGYVLIGLAVVLFVLSFLHLYNRQMAARQELVYLDRLNEKKLKYYTNISHEFKTPLSLILSPVQDILDDRKATGDIREYAEQIKRNASYLLNLVEQILDFRKIREEKMYLKVSEMNIAAFIEKICTQFQPLANKKQIDFSCSYENSDISGYIDGKVLTKVLYNLLSNAFKFTPASGSIAIILEDFNDEGYISIHVKDEGGGIEKKDRDKLFERFARSENSSGIGLFFVKELVTKHRGRIEVDSEPGRGTIFTVILPAHRKHYEQEELASAEGHPDSPGHADPEISETGYEDGQEKLREDKLLIIEDNEEMRQYLSKKFRDLYQVHSAANGKEGLEMAIREIPEFIICDLMMPVMDGLETLAALKENFITSHIPVILLTADSSEEKRISGIETGAVDYITKPFEFNLLKLKIDNYISGKKALISKFRKEPELPANVLTSSEQDRKFIEDITAIVNECIGNTVFNIDILAQRSGHSRTSLYHKMKGITGITPHQFIFSLQMKKAALLLQKTNYTIAEVGIMSGFSDANYFGKSFKKHFGKTPKSYQVEMRRS